jgi:prepilin-type N-terminal cleavage/methylation domain-containing protein
MNKFKKARKAAGFTLVEIMVSVTIVGVVVGMAILIVFQALSTYYYDVGRVEVNQDMRKLTRDMTTNAVFSNYFLIYPNFATRTISTGSGSAATTVDDLMGDGQSGDMVLFVTDNTDSSTGVQLISRIVGYYRDGTTSVAGPVRQFLINVPVTSTQTQTVYSILNTYQPTSNQSTNTTVIPLAQDIGTGLLFYNFYNHSVMLKSDVLEPGTISRYATSTYNFTVSPRG